ncbi:uncharacterized protein LOC18444236 isoform X2 [Amborella trichopoda]|uniref:uncharacterized protein LOC18444236 isoform X2 n=1 Tax=Amborella trichopoda TaxID=13333 RepID=UPI0009C192C0|nr:uncharacterized protein LOC18444236 isoform X2 [Amborella trichopoda]|eukprot:XP_020529180.1 uncharacterized protein LOC18444236 isoform X2 [Amborella trichopoda]
MWQKLQLLYAWYFSERLTRDTQNGALIAFDVGDLLAALSDEGSLKVMLLCGSDLLESFDIPGAWICDQGDHKKRFFCYKLDNRRSYQLH